MSAQVLMDKVASVLDRRAESSPQVAAAGMVINTMGWIDGPGYDLLLYCIKALQVRGFHYTLLQGQV